MDEGAFFAALSGLTDDDKFDGAMEQLYLISKIETGLKQAACGQLVAQETAWERIRAWLA